MGSQEWEQKKKREYDLPTPPFERPTRLYLGRRFAQKIQREEKLFPREDGVLTADLVSEGRYL